MGTEPAERRISETTRSMGTEPAEEEKKEPRASPWQLLWLCAVGFLVNCQPSEAYLTSFLKTDKHLTSVQLDNDVWPYDTYGSFAFLVPMGLVAELCGYPAAIAAGLACRQVTRILLLFFGGVQTMAIMQLTYAAATAANTVYFAYVYMCVHPDQFMLATCLIHSSYYFGNALGSLLGQMLYSYAGWDQHLARLFWLSWGFSASGLLVFLTRFPPALRKAPVSLVSVCRSEGAAGLLQSLRSMYSQRSTLLWSTWWLLGPGSHSMIANYYQTQFTDIDPGCGDSLGYVEAAMMLLSALASVVPNLSGCGPGLRHQVPTIGFTTAIMAFLYYGATVWQQSIWYSYGLNSAAISLYSFQYATASAVIASQDASHRYAVLFTVNSFFSYGIATVISQVGSHHDLTTSEYYQIASLEQVGTLVLAVGVVLGYWYHGGSGQGDKADNKGMGDEYFLLGDESHESL
eukprot:TRINITY_DN19071_c0_g1_i1.p1 TRINITY_DN19071_c0_g1~~TRINITY_DN19071_c0_g1_i1.p1  ORF type:complete len:460 (-),score=83.71 TRINITY_DN19071_c0_g1_i1:155-1534(-)